MNLLVVAQDSVDLPDVTGRLAITFVSLLIGVGIGGWLLGRDSVVLKLLGFIPIAGAAFLAIAQWTSDAGWRLVGSVVAVLVLALSQLVQGGAKTTGQKIALLATGAVAVLALTVLVPGVVDVPEGGVRDIIEAGIDILGDVIASGWDAVTQMFTAAETAVEP